MGINVNNCFPSENICELYLAMHYWLLCFCGAVMWLGHCHCYLYYWEMIKRWHMGWRYRQMSGCKYQLICNMFVSSEKKKSTSFTVPFVNTVCVCTYYAAFGLLSWNVMSNAAAQFHCDYLRSWEDKQVLRLHSAVWSKNQFSVIPSLISHKTGWGWYGCCDGGYYFLSLPFPTTCQSLCWWKG